MLPQTWWARSLPCRGSKGNPRFSCGYEKRQHTPEDSTIGGLGTAAAISCVIDYLSGWFVKAMESPGCSCTSAACSAQRGRPKLQRTNVPVGLAEGQARRAVRFTRPMLRHGKQGRMQGPLEGRCTHAAWPTRPPEPRPRQIIALAALLVACGCLPRRSHSIVEVWCP